MRSRSALADDAPATPPAPTPGGAHAAEAPAAAEAAAGAAAPSPKGLLAAGAPAAGSAAAALPLLRSPKGLLLLLPPPPPPLPPPPLPPRSLTSRSSPLCPKPPPPPMDEAKLPTLETEASSSSTSAPMLFSQCDERVRRRVMRPSMNESSTASLDLSGVAYEARSIEHVPSFFSEPSGVSSRNAKEAVFVSKAPLRLLNMVQMRARSCVVVAVREREPSMLESVSLMANGSVTVRRGPRFHTSTSLPAMSAPGSETLMSWARK